MKDIHEGRRKRLTEWMKKEGVDAVVFHDYEDLRSSALRYLTGQPGNAVYVQSVDGKSAVCAFDIVTPKINAYVDCIIDISGFNRSPLLATEGCLKELGIKAGGTIELPAEFSVPMLQIYKENLSYKNILCRGDGASDFVKNMQRIKDAYEIDCHKKAAEITDGIIDLIIERAKSDPNLTEADVFGLIEVQCRIEGCEGTGCMSLIAGPSRTGNFFSFPMCSDKPWGTKGLSIVDFGVSYQGYTSDISLTIAKDISKKQEAQLKLVEEVYEAALKLYRPGISVNKAAKLADDIYSSKGYSMPHNLGHGIGLFIHEYPFVSRYTEENVKFEPGMIVTLEPGLYSQEFGGCRYENDILITADGNEQLTHSRIVRL